MSHRCFIAAATICSALALQVACAIGRGIQDTLGAMASGGEYRKPPASGVASVLVRTAADSVEVGDTVMFNYDIVPPKGKIVSGSVNVRWESSDTSVATVERGWVVGKKVGVATIFATADGVRGSTKVTVTPKTQPGG